MSKAEAFKYMTKHGYTKTSVDHPEISKEWAWEHLNASGHSYELTRYYRDFIEANFS